MFDDIDVDGSGSVDYDEFRSLLTKTGLQFVNEEAKLAFRSIDRSGYDLLDRDAFCRFILPSKGGKHHLKLIDHEYSLSRSKLFHAINDMRISKKELEAAENYFRKHYAHITEIGGGEGGLDTEMSPIPTTEISALLRKQTTSSNNPNSYSNQLRNKRQELEERCLELFSDSEFGLIDQLELSLKLLSKLEENTKYHQLTFRKKEEETLKKVHEQEKEEYQHRIEQQHHSIRRLPSTNSQQSSSHHSFLNDLFVTLVNPSSVIVTTESRSPSHLEHQQQQQKQEGTSQQQEDRAISYDTL
jgi:hypothetical protein